MKKKWVISAIVPLAVSTLLISPASAKSDQAKQSLVSLGDSITFGYNLGINNQHPSKEAFPFVIGQDEGFRVRDLGVPGWHSDQLLNAIETDDTFKGAIRHADYITLDIGSNDLLQALTVANGDPNSPVFKNAISYMLSNTTKTITDIRNLTDAPIVVYNIYNPFQTNDPLHAMSDLLLPNIINPAIANIVYSLTTQGNVTELHLADAYKAFGQNQATFVRLNDIHPTAEGQQVLAQIGEQALGLSE